MCMWNIRVFAAKIPDLITHQVVELACGSLQPRFPHRSMVDENVVLNKRSVRLSILYLPIEKHLFINGNKLY